MAYDIETLTDQIGRTTFAARIEDLLNAKAVHYRRLWSYYKNPMLPRAQERDEQGADRPYRQAQEWGLPSRLTGVRSAASGGASQTIDDVARKEVVVENDIGWRIDTMVDFLFGAPVAIRSRAAGAPRRAEIEAVLNAVLDENGGQVMFQHLATLGAVYGFVDVLVKLDPANLDTIRAAVREQIAKDSTPADDADPASSRPPEAPVDSTRAADDESADGAPLSSATAAGPASSSLDEIVSSETGDPRAAVLPAASLSRKIARAIRFEIVEPARALPVTSQTDWREVTTYAQVYTIPRPARPRRNGAGASEGSFIRRLGNTAGRLFRSAATRSAALSFRDASDEQILVTELISPARWDRYENERLVASGVNSLGRIPLVHIQNLASPFEYSGTSEVEPLVPLQDELNTRLSDRANRIALQSFKMYLGKGIDGFTDLPVAPGRMWMTDNPDAQVIEFGGDSASPSEDRHIAEIREAMDKLSAVTPIAAGAIRGRVGNLTSAAALRVTMMALIARVQRKRITYGQAIERLCDLTLAWLDQAGLFHTSPQERAVRVEWPAQVLESSSSA